MAIKGMRKGLKLRVCGETVALRLTVAGQRELQERFNEETIQTVLSAASDRERMVALLDTALNWKGNENPVTDGEELYDLLVDEDYAGVGQFSALALDIARVSGVISEEQKNTAKAFVAQTVNQVFGSVLSTGEENASVPVEPESDADAENPTPAAP